MGDGKTFQSIYISACGEFLRSTSSDCGCIKAHTYIAVFCKKLIIHENVNDGVFEGRNIMAIIY